MQALGTDSLSQDPPADAPRPWSDWSYLALLLLASVALHAWIIGHTAVVARDSIGYIRYALLLEQRPWTEALPRLEQHPLYPMTVLAVSLPVRYFLGGTSAETMALSCQIASALAGVLLALPLYFLGRALFDRRVGFWAAALFQTLPIGAQVTSDGLSDGVFLLSVSTALLLAVLALRHRSSWSFVACGLATGLAYLARPEGALVTIAVLLVLGSLQAVVAWRWPWRSALASTAGLLAGAAAVAVPYMAIIGHVTVKPAARKLLINHQPEDTLGRPPTGETSENLSPNTWSADSPLLATVFALWWMDEQRAGAPPFWWGVKAVVLETMHAFHYGACWPALLGLWWFRARWQRDPGAWVVLVLCALLGLLLLRVALGVHYLSERHTLILVLCGSIWAAAALVRLGDSLPTLLERWTGRPMAPRGRAALTCTWLLLWTGWCLPADLKPLHASRLGHRAAGQWLAEHASATDHIRDPYCWAHFYAGRVFIESPESARPAGQPPPLEYVVLTNSKNAHERLFGLNDAKERVGKRDPVFRWTPTPWQRKHYRAEEVVVYAVPSAK